MNKPTVYTRPRSKWWYVSWYHSGKRTQKSCKPWGICTDTHTEDEAVQAIMFRLGLSSVPGLAQENGTKDLAWFRTYLQRRLNRESKRKGTVYLYLDSIDRLTALFGSSWLISDIKRTAVGRLQDAMIAQGISPAYINLTCRHIRAAFNRLVKDEFLDKNPFQGFEKLRESNNGKPLHLKPDEVNRFLAAVRNIDREDLRRLIPIYLFTGRRRTEILNTPRWKVDLNHMLMSVKNVKDRGHTEQMLDIPEAIQDDIRWLMEQNSSDYPFRVCRPNTLTRRVKECMRAADLPEEYHLHTLRHTFVTLAPQSGENIWKVKEWLGHSTVLVTEGYAHDHPSGGISLGVEHMHTGKV